jgi:hypothetical protein
MLLLLLLLHQRVTPPPHTAWHGNSTDRARGQLLPLCLTAVVA